MSTNGSSSHRSMSAHQKAVKALIAENQERFDELRRNERVALGLPPVAGGKSPAVIRAQMAKAQKRLDALAAELAKVEA